MAPNIIFALGKRINQSIEKWINSWNPYHPSHLQEKNLQPIAIEESEIRKTVARWLLGGTLLFFIWGILVPIDAGVDVNGSMIVSGYRKSVQHPSGGVIQEIRVQEGSIVKQGDVLVTINPLNTEANLSNAELQYINLLVTESRLKAERLKKNVITWDLDLEDWKNDKRVQHAKALQLELFHSRQQEYANQLAILNTQIDGITKSIAARKIQLHTLDEELHNNQQLAQEGFVPKNAANATLRTKLEVETGLITALSELTKLKTQIAQHQAAYYKDIDNQLAELHKNRETMQRRFEAAHFDRTQTEIRAPASGQVVGLKVFTQGGVIQPGAVLMEIVPNQASLIAEVKVPTHLIDKVHPGLLADMRFLAFNQATTPVIPGQVTLVGADKQPSNNAQEDFYLAHIELTTEGLKQLAQLKIQPGMPVSVMIKTGERSFFSYLLKPLTDKFKKAFNN